MSYQVLARKWRPQNFKSLVGQEHVLRALINALDNNRLHHAYLFTGTRGVGKTTIARILARCLNCETGVTSEPCGVCSSCLEITEGRFIDLIEVDAASKTRVEDTRELLENVQYLPSKGRYKVYLIDEVHMLSTHSFNALLKTLEEPPPHVKFLLATTDPQKLPVTILSRCLQFNLKNMSPEKIVGHLAYVLEAEQIPFEQAALWQLGRAADGSMRDALSLTDQAIAFGHGSVSDADVTVMLGAIDQTALYEILHAMAASDAAGGLAIIEKLSEYAPDYSGVLTELVSLFHRIAVAQVIPDAIDNAQGDREFILNLARQFTGEDIQLYYQIGLIGRRDLPLAPEPRSGLEMTLLRMLAFKPEGVMQPPLQPLSQSPSGPQEKQLPQDLKAAEGVASTSSTANNELINRTPNNSGEFPAKKSEAVPAAVLGGDDFACDDRAGIDTEFTETQPLDKQQLPAQNELTSATVKCEQLSEEVITDSVLPQLSPAKQILQSIADETSVHETNAQETAEPVTLENLTPALWYQVYCGLDVKGVLKTIIANCEIQRNEGNKILLLLDQQHATLFNESHVVRLTKVLEGYFGQSLELSVQLGEVQSETPAARVIRQKQQRHTQAVENFKNNDNVQHMLDVFSAALIDETIRPLES